ncbi:putative peptide transporter [Myriangium duriaei CBS 260.36]|uniref:Peptide transporter n=1 Tax=Myriangium duriaei CBS 260.36 TaxID=1168546 RepID=A0A9P4MQ18_9PEZI|nr:putative peptide transporter [Myriangium duriaei CBS 260.36]
MPALPDENENVLAEAVVTQKHLAAEQGSAIDDNASGEITGGISEEDLQNLRRVSGKITWIAFTIAVVELCERFSYYGTTVVFVNFIQHPLPPGSNTGAGHAGQSGALNMGQRASTGLSTFNQFWAYVTPLLGAYVADAKLGRYKTIHIAIAVAIVGHVILTVSAIPSVISTPKTAIGIFSLGLVIFGVGTGFFKSNVAPLLAEQQKDMVMRIETTKTGERVIVDPAITTSRLYLYFYFCINIGSLTGQIGMVYAEKYVGFWLAYLLPTVLFLVAPIVLAVFKKQYTLNPPTGSILAKFFKMWTYTLKGTWSFNLAEMKRNFTWDKARPSYHAPGERPYWMDYDDAWVDEVRRGLKACKVFLFLPLYWLAYNQMTANLTSQAATMVLNGVPNDIIQNLNPISLLIMIPIFDMLVYPGLRKLGFHFTPIKRMTMGFYVASMAMIAACVTQVYIYRMSPCGTHATTCKDADGNTLPAQINVWVLSLPYVLIGISEIFTSITALEYAFSKAPTNMRSLVLAINYLMNAFSGAVAQGLVALSEDPLLVWNYGVVAVLAFLGGTGFWLCYHNLDRDEDKWNMLQATQFVGKKPGDVAAEQDLALQEKGERPASAAP